MTAVSADCAAIGVYGVASGIGAVNVNDCSWKPTVVLVRQYTHLLTSNQGWKFEFLSAVVVMVHHPLLCLVKFVSYTLFPHCAMTG